MNFVLITILSIALLGQCNKNKINSQPDKPQDNFTETLPKMGQ